MASLDKRVFSFMLLPPTVALYGVLPSAFTNLQCTLPLLRLRVCVCVSKWQTNMLLRPTRNSVSLFSECLVGYWRGALDQQNQLTSLARTLVSGHHTEMRQWGPTNRPIDASFSPPAADRFASVLLSLLISNRDYRSISHIQVPTIGA